MKRYLIAILLALLVVPASALAEGKVKEVVAEGKAEVSADRTMQDARNLAMKRAERSALEMVVGTDIRSTTTVYNADVINDMIVAGSKGIIVSKEILAEASAIEGDRIYRTVKIKAKIQALDRSLKSPYKIKLNVQRPGSKGKQSITVFAEGDEAVVKVRLDKSGYINIFSVDQNGKLYPLYPNEYAQSMEIEGQKEFVFPDSKLREMGLKMITSTLNGAAKSHESIVVVATKQIEIFFIDTKTPHLPDLMSELAALGQENWAQATKGYTILK